LLSLVQITDSHLFADPHGRLKGVSTLDSLQALIQHCQLRHPDPDLVLATGDLSHDGSAASYRHFASALDCLSAPVLWIPGNHDDVSIMQRQLSGDNFSAERCRQAQGWNIIMLDTAVSGEEWGFLSVEELAFLDEMLANWPEYPALIGLHHPPVAVGSSWLDNIGLSNADEFFDVLDRHRQVRTAVFGHVHQAFETRYRGIHLLASPSSCIQFKPNEDAFMLDDAPAGYRWLRLHESGRIETGVDFA